MNKTQNINMENAKKPEQYPVWLKQEDSTYSVWYSENALRDKLLEIHGEAIDDKIFFETEFDYRNGKDWEFEYHEAQKDLSKLIAFLRKQDIYETIECIETPQKWDGFLKMFGITSGD